MSEDQCPAPSELEALARQSMPPARGGRRPAHSSPIFQVVREITLADLALRSAKPSSHQAVPAPLLRGKLRAAHHQLAQLIAKGTDSNEIQLITGYSASYISNIRHDPAFAELVAYYHAQGKDLFIDALSIMRDAGVDAAEELRSRLRGESPANAFANRELLEVIDTTINKPMNAVANSRRGVDPRPDGGGQTNVNIKFIQAQPPAIVIEHDS